MLKARIASPDHEEAFLQRYQRLRSLALHVVENDPQAAGDLLHDVFLQFSLSHPNLRTIGNLDGYLYRMLQNMHLSQLRRSSRRPEVALPVLDFESATTGLETLTRQAAIQAGDDLRRICEYALLRKNTSKSASVLILRFFHAYYPAEIAQVLRKSRNFIDRALRVARVEAKAYLADPDSLSFINKNPKGVRLATEAQSTTGDVLLDIRNLIFSSPTGDCPDDLATRFRTTEAEGPDCQTLAHIVSCEVCLDLVNETLELPRLSARNPENNLRRDTRAQKKSKGGGPPTGGSGAGGGEMDDFVGSHRQRVKEAREHHPQELRISVNGFIVGAHTVNSELSKQSLTVNLEERISFVEVFSDLDLRLLFCSVEPPPDGPGTYRERVELSDGRVLELKLDFADSRPQVDVTYRDPAFQVVPSAQSGKLKANQTEDDATSSVPREEFKRLKKFKTHLSSLLEPMREGLLRPGFWLRPGTVTALVMLLLVASLLMVYRRGPAPAVTAASLLQKAALAEETLAANRDQVLHRTIALEEKNASGELIAQRQVEVWQSAERGITARRLYDQKGLLVAGDWRRADGVQTLYHHARKLQLQLSPEKRSKAGSSITFETAWQLSPSAKEFGALIASLDAAHLEERGSSYVLTYQNEGTSTVGQGLIRATLTLGKTDLHATEQTLVLRQGSEERTFRYLETSFERRPLSAVAPAVFEPEPELLGEAGKVKSEGKTADATVATSSAPSILATPELEVEVLRLLNSVGGDLSDQVSVTRTSDGRLHIDGTVETAARKTEILRALSSVANHPAVKISVETVAEAEKRQQQSSAGTPKTIELQQVQIAKAALPVEPELRRYFASRGLPADQLDQEITKFASRIMRRSLQTRLHARTLKQTVNRFSPDDLRGLTQEARQKLMALIREQAGSLHRELSALRSELQVVVSGGAMSAEQMELASDADLLHAINRLGELVSQSDESIRASFSISSEGSGAAPVRDATFWRSLKSAESLAARISRQ